MNAKLFNRYFDYKVYSLIRDRTFNIINAYRKDEKEQDIYKHIFLAPDAIARKRAFQLQGVIYPYIALWANSQFDWTDQWSYSRSCLRRDFSYENPVTKEVNYCNGFLYDMTKEYVIYSSSYFQTFIQSVAEDLTDFDRLRYFDIDCSELLPGFVSHIEFKPKGRNFTSSVDEKKSERNFTGAYLYDMSVTFPVIDKDKFLDKVEIYLNDNKIFESEVSVG